MSRKETSKKDDDAREETSKEDGDVGEWLLVS